MITGVRRSTSIVTVAFVAAMFVFATMGTALAHCKNEKCEAGQDNGNHYGQEKSEDTSSGATGAGQNNGNHYGQEKNDLPAPAQSSVRATSTTSGSVTSDSSGPSGKKRNRRRDRKQEEARAAAASQAAAAAVELMAERNLKHFAADPPATFTFVQGRRTTRELAWEPTSTRVDALGLAGSAVEAARTLAFPLGLALAVSAFLLLQGRIDRRDPKLVVWRQEMAQFE